MPLLLLLEDNPADLRRAADTAQKAGFECEIFTYATEAVAYLEKALAGHARLPDAMVVDLDLGIESGYELLRCWHGNGELKGIPVVVWTVMGYHEREICRLFGVTHFVNKDESLLTVLHSLGGDAGTSSRSA